MSAIDYAARQAKLWSAVQADAVVLVPGANLRYFSGLTYKMWERPIVVVITTGQFGAVVPAQERAMLDNRSDLNAQVFPWRDKEGYAGAFRALVEALELEDRTLGVDGQAIRFFETQALRKAGVRRDMLDIGEDLLRLRQSKTADEIALIRQAAQITSLALRRVMEWVEPGMSELRIDARVKEELAKAGSSGLAFEPQTLTGPNSALPHGSPGERILQRDDFLQLDFGGRYGGYAADITRTFCLGRPTAEMQKIYDVVLRACEATKAVARPGVACGAVDAAARRVIAEAGYADYFPHRTGHGLGLDGHELPQIAAGVETPLEPGMVFTIEPGIYLPRLGGVRIEDDIVVTESGIEVLTQYPTGLTTLL